MTHKVYEVINFIIAMVALFCYFVTGWIEIAVVAIIYTVFSAENAIVAEIKDALKSKEDD